MLQKLHLQCFATKTGINQNYHEFLAPQCISGLHGDSQVVFLHPQVITLSAVDERHAPVKPASHWSLNSSRRAANHVHLVAHKAERNNESEQTANVSGTEDCALPLRQGKVKVFEAPNLNKPLHRLPIHAGVKVRLQVLPEG